jgi:hypothetical protein
MTYMKVNQASSPTRTTWLPREDDTVVGRDALPGASVVNFYNFPAKKRACRKQHECQGHAFLVASQKSKESLHVQLY